MSIDAAYASIEPEFNRRAAIVFVEATAQLVLGLFFVAAIVQKVAVNGDVIGFVDQFTNWSWTLQTLTYLLTLGVPFVEWGLVRVDSPLGRFTEVVTVFLFFATLGLTFVVVIAISIILALDPTFLNDLLISTPATLIVIGNDIYHVWTVVFILVYYIAHHRYIWYSLNRLLNRHGVIASPWRQVFVIVYLVYLQPGFALLIYSWINDPHVIYRTKIPDAVGILIVIVTLTGSVLIGTLLVLYGYGVAYVLLDVWWLLRNEVLPSYVIELKQR
jgi:hypothetical protein